MSATPSASLPLLALSALLDSIIPPDPVRGLPGAGELGLAAAIDAIPELRPVVAEALAGLDERARARGAEDFSCLDARARSAVLNDQAAAQPDLLPGLVFHTYVRYYREPRVLAALGLEPRPPHPLGYPLEQADLDALLSGVRKRGGLYRRV